MSRPIPTDELLDLLRESDAERNLREEGVVAERQPTSEQPEFIGGFIGGTTTLSKGLPTYGPEGTPTYEHDLGLRGEALRAHDERRDVAEWVANLLGLRLGHESTWSVGAHRLKVRLEVEDDSRRWVVRIVSGWPTEAPRKSLALHEAFAIATTTKLRKVAGPEATRWKLRLLVEAGVIEAPSIALSELPPSAPESAVGVWREVGSLLSIRGLNEPAGSPFPLSAPWVAGWTGGRLTESEIVAGKRWLEGHGFLVRAGASQGRRGGKPLVLWNIAFPTSSEAA